MADTSPSKGRRKISPAFLKPLTPDEDLQAVIGPEPRPRTEIISKIWDYIRSHELQDPADRKFIKADDRLRKVFGGRDRVSMFELTKHVFQHAKSQS